MFFDTSSYLSTDVLIFILEKEYFVSSAYNRSYDCNLIGLCSLFLTQVSCVLDSDYYAPHLGYGFDRSRWVCFGCGLSQIKR